MTATHFQYASFLATSPAKGPRISAPASSVSTSQPKKFNWKNCTLPVAQVPGQHSLEEVIALAQTGELGATELPANQIW